MTADIWPSPNSVAEEYLKRVADDAAAVETLVAELSAMDPRQAEKVLDALGRSRSPVAGPLLLIAGERLPSKGLRKAARLGLHRLRAAGIAVEGPPRTAPVYRAAPARARVYEAWATHIDGAGNRIVWMAAERPAGGIWLVRAFLNYESGLQNIVLEDSTRKKFPRELEDFRRRAPAITWVQLPPEYALGLVQEAASISQESGQPLPPAYAFYQEAVEGAARPLGQALVYRELNATGVRLHPQLLEDSPGLMEEPELSGWIFPEEEVRSYAVELLQARESPLVISEQASEEREERLVSRAIEQLFSPALRQSFRRRMEEMAYVFIKTGRPEQGRQALAVAIDLASDRPLTLNPFVRELVSLSIEVAAERQFAGHSGTGQQRPVRPSGARTLSRRRPASEDAAPRPSLFLP